MLTAFFWLLALFMAVLTLSVRPMGAWLAPLASGQAPARLAGFDRALLRLMGVRDAGVGLPRRGAKAEVPVQFRRHGLL